MLFVASSIVTGGRTVSSMSTCVEIVRSRITEVEDLLRQGAIVKDIAKAIDVPFRSLFTTIDRYPDIRSLVSMAREAYRKTLSESDLKRCSRCGKLLPTDSFGVNAYADSGLMSMCKECTRILSNENKRVMRERNEANAVVLKPKKCLECNIFREPKEFGVSPLYVDGLRSRCRDCENAKGRIWRNTKLESAPQELKIKSMISTAKVRSKKLGLPFNIDRDYVRTLIVHVCPYLHIPINWENRDKAAYDSPSLDKITPSQGYIVGNCQIISNRANMLKTNATVEELLLMAEGLQRTFWGTTVIEMMQ